MNSLPPLSVLARYPLTHSRFRWVRVSGGFSGADVWRGNESGEPAFALKAWPPEMTAARLASIHARLAQASHLPFVPAVLPARDGETLVPEADRVWDVTRWMPGSPLAAPTEADVEAACVAVARLHAAWPASPRAMPCPGVLNRLRVLADFRNFFQPGSLLPLAGAPELAPLLRRARDAVARVAPAVEEALRRWEAVPLPLRPCVRDLRGEHVLFTGPAVTGIVDFGAMGEDHPAVDLARLLGDLAGENETLFAAGLRGYRSAGGLEISEELVRLLDRTGVVGSVVGWLVRLLVDRRLSAEPAAVAARIGHLLGRVGSFDTF